MTSISSMGAPGLPMPSSSAGRAAPPRVEARLPQPPAPSPATTQVTLDAGAAAANELVYAKPKAAEPAPLFARTRSWATAAQRGDEIGGLMARNVDGRTAKGGLADSWRGLGGALLARFAATPANYRQTLVDTQAPQTPGSPAGTSTEAIDAQLPDLDQPDATQVSLKIQTRSGQTVALKISMSRTEGDAGGEGLQVEIAGSGPLEQDEREALAKLADGLDRALEGLGHPERPQLDLAGLMKAYDGKALTGLELSIRNPKPQQALESFSLSLGAERKALALKGAAGEVALNLDLSTPLRTTDPQQRQAAIQQHLRQFDAAAQRSRADAGLVALFKDAFAQMHGAAAPPEQPAAADDALGDPALARQLQPLHSGLQDFQASFGGDFKKTTERGAINEIGRADYTLSQKTTVRRQGGAGEMSITQERSEQLDAHSLKSRFGGMLDTSSGNYDIRKVKDSLSTTTLIERTKDQPLRALRKTEQQQLETREALENHRVTERSSLPATRNFLERLR